MVPSNIGMSVEMLRDMVVEVNTTQVAPEEVLTDSVYRYDSKHDQIVLA